MGQWFEDTLANIKESVQEGGTDPSVNPQQTDQTRAVDVTDLGYQGKFVPKDRKDPESVSNEL